MDEISRNNRPIAHAAKDANGQWRRPHHLEDHLAGVAAVAGCLASAFGAEDWARLAGLWHDLGKFRPLFQAYIRNASGFEAENAHVEGVSGRSRTPPHPSQDEGCDECCRAWDWPGQVRDDIHRRRRLAPILTNICGG